MRPWMVAALGVAVLLSGCASSAAPKAETVTGTKDERTTVRLPPGASAIEGYVIDDEMKPLMGAHVQVSGLPLRTLSDANGRFFLGPVTPGTYEVLAERTGHEARSRSFTTKADETLLVAMVLRAAALPEPYQALDVQKGILACGIGAQVHAASFDAYQGDLYQDCAPATGAAWNSARPVPTDVNDRSRLAWSARNTEDLHGAKFEVRWTAGTAFAQRLSAFIGSDCAQKPLVLLAGDGASPLKLERARPGVDGFVRQGGSSDCGEEPPCQTGSCALRSQIRAAPSAQSAGAGVGAAIQQSFEATLTLQYHG